MFFLKMAAIRSDELKIQNKKIAIQYAAFSSSWKSCQTAFKTANNSHQTAFQNVKLWILN